MKLSFHFIWLSILLYITVTTLSAAGDDEEVASMNLESQLDEINREEAQKSKTEEPEEYDSYQEQYFDDMMDDPNKYTKSPEVLLQMVKGARAFSIEDELTDISTSCACSKASILYFINTMEEAKIVRPKSEVKNLATELQNQIRIHLQMNASTSEMDNYKSDCESLQKVIENSPRQLLIIIDPGLLQRCGVAKDLVKETPLVEFNSVSQNDSTRWQATIQSNSVYLLLEIRDWTNEDEMKMIMFTIKHACAPTVGRSNITETFKKMAWSDASARFQASVSISALLFTVAGIMMCVGFWILGMFVYQKIKNVELREQRAIRLYIAELVKQEHEKEEKEEQERLEEMLKKYSMATTQATEGSSMQGSS